MKTILLPIFLLFTIINLFAIDPPTLVSPINGASNQDSQVNLDWNFVTGNTGYSYEIDIASDFSSPFYDYGDVASSAVTISNLFFGTTYYWRARTKGAVDTSVWTETWSFTTNSFPVLTSPINGAINQQPQTIIDWVGYPGNTGYIYELDIIASFDSPEIIYGNTAVNSSQQTISDLFFGTTYYWRVAIKNGSDTSDWSETRSFTILDNFTNVSPFNGALNQHSQTGLDWTGITGNIGYIYEIDTDPGFSTPFLLTGTTGINTSNVDVSNLFFNTTYYWHAAVKTNTDTSGWSDTWSFTSLSAVSNVSPSNGAVNQQPETIIDWTAVTGNSGYIYELDTSPGFSSPFYQTGNAPVNSSNFTLTGLLFNTTYYWRAAAKTLTDTSDWSLTWSFSTISTLTNISPSNGANDQFPELTIDWTSATGNTGYLYRADTTEDFTSPLLIIGTTAINSSQFTLSDLRFEKTYYWQAAAKTATDTSDWSELWSFTVIKKVENISPTDASVNQATSLAIDWSTITGNSGYLFQLDTSSGFSSPVYVQAPTPVNVSQTNVGDLFFGTTYYWNAACKTVSDTSIWGDTWAFSTLDAAVNVSPGNNAVGISINPTIDWQSMTGNQGYLYQLDTTPDFNSSFILEGASAVNVSQYSFSGLMNGATYYWHAAIKNNADTSGWGPTWSFNTTFTLTFAPILTSPANGATNIPVDVLELTWEPVAGATEYQYQYATDAGFSSGLAFGITSDLTLEIGGLDNITTYYWHVRASNGTGYSPWSATWTFTTEEIEPGIPVLVSPENSAAEIPVNTLLVWNVASDADSYEYQYGTDIGFTSFSDGTISNTQDIISGLLFNQTYFWRVRAFNGIVEGEWSEIWSFTTQEFTLEAPVLISPENEASNQPISLLTLDWGDVSGVYSYDIEYSTDSDFIENLNQESSFGSLFIINADLFFDTIYFWRVRAFDGIDVYSEWSSEWWFRTMEDPLYAEILFKPVTMVYPNPFDSKLFIENPFYNISNIRLINIIGEEVFYSSNVVGNEFNMNLIPSGIYFLEILFENNTIEIHKLVKR